MTYLPIILRVTISCSMSETKKMTTFFTVGGSPDLVVMGGDSRSEGCEFEPQHRILDVIFHIDLLQNL